MLTSHSSLCTGIGFENKFTGTFSNKLGLVLGFCFDTQGTLRGEFAFNPVCGFPLSRLRFQDEL
jgi:hypothetical protein